MGIETQTVQEIATKKLNKKKMETSKKIMWASYIITVTLTAIVVVGSLMGQDMGNVTTLAALAWGEVAVCNHAYMSKSAKENVPKIISSLPKFFQEQVDVNQLLNQ